MKALPPEPSESFDSAMKTAQSQQQPQAQASDQQQSSQKTSQKTSQSDSKPETKKTSKSTKGKQANKKADRVDKQPEDQDEQDVDPANTVTAADATGEDSTDGGDKKGGKKKDAQQVAAAGKTASKTDPLLQALAVPTKTITVRDASKEDEADESAATAKTTALKTPVQKKATATAAKAVDATKKGKAADQAEDAEQLQDADDAVNQADEADDADSAQQQAAGKPAKSKAPGLGADDDPEPAYGAGPALKAQNTQTDQLSAQQQQAADDAAMAAAAASAMPMVSNDTPAPSDSGSSAVASIDHLTALATDLTSSSSVQGKTAAATTIAAQTSKGDAASVAAQAFTPPEVQFADSNHAKIVSGIQGQLMPNGGTMQIRLDPPELGALQVSVQMKDGVVNATFQTSNDNATNVLSHSLSQLKHALETQGVSVDKLHVQQAPKDHQASSDDQQQKNQNPSEQSQQKQEQQRRELLQRMWKRLTNGSDPLDMVA